MPARIFIDFCIAVGLTSRHLVIPISEHQDTVGSMAKTVMDAAHILQVIAGPDMFDNYTSAIPGGIVPDYINACDLTALSGSRIGIPRNVLPFFTTNSSGPVLHAFHQSLGIMQIAGAVVVEDTNFTAAEQFFNIGLDLQKTVMNADFLADLPRYLNSLTENPSNITSLAGLRDFTRSTPDEDYPIRDTGKWDKALQQGWDNTSPEFLPAYQKLLHYGNEGGLLGALERHKLDAIVLPTQMASSWAAIVGSPIVSVPMGAYPANAPIVRDSWGLVTSAPNIP
jgi:amidase